MNAISIDIDQLDTLPAKTLLAAVAKQKDVQRFFAQVFAALKDHAPLFLALEKYDIEPRIDPDYLNICVAFSGDGRKLGLVWGALRRHGWNTTERPKKGDTQFHGSFTQEGQPRISLFFTSTLCRRVQVGTQTVEQPIYETICGGLGELPEVTDPVAVAAPGAVIPF